VAGSTGYGTVFAFRCKHLHAQTCTNRRSHLCFQQICLASSNHETSLVKEKSPRQKPETLFLAGSTGFEPAISSVTGRRGRPLHYEPSSDAEFLPCFGYSPKASAYNSHPPLKFTNRQVLVCKFVQIAKNRGYIIRIDVLAQCQSVINLLLLLEIKR
jgi:hypothetical protein